MEYYSLLIDIQNKPVLVIGQYRILEFKIEKLIEAGAKIKYLSDSLSPKLKKHVDAGKIKYLNQEYEEKLLDDVWLVVCGSDEDNLKKKIENATKERHIFCNFVDEPIPSTFISPSVIKKGDIIVSISTKGKSPSLNRLLKKKFSDFLGDEYPKFTELMGNVRQKVLDKIEGQKKRAELFDSIVHNPEILNLIKQNKISEAEKIIFNIVEVAIKNTI